jgi:putative tryptophan/tyrosine transport system substrate-binding protein
MQFDQLKRRDLLRVLGGTAAWPFAARAQQVGKLPRVGVLVSASPPHPFADALWRGLRPLGYRKAKTSQ